MTQVYIAGGAMIPFASYPNILVETLGQVAVLKTLKDAEIDKSQVQAIYCSNVFGGMLPGQRVCLEMGLTGPPVINVENACASGATAIDLAFQALMLGKHDTVLVVGMENLSNLGGGTLPLNNADWNNFRGLTLPANYAFRAQRYLFERNVGPEVLAGVSVKSRANGVLNPYAFFREPVTIEQVLQSRIIADPLTLLQCCPSNSDGAAAVILTIQKPINGRRPVQLSGCSIQSGRHKYKINDLLDAEITVRTSRLAYEAAGIGPEDIDLVECHDAFTISELMYYEALGLCKPGEGPKMIADKETSIGGRIPFNPSGGLMSRGHPIGATGVAQAVEIMWHLQRIAGERQVADANVGLAHTTGGGIAGTDHGACGVMIYKA
jgi:acetyl-CoA acetyltransferase